MEIVVTTIQQPTPAMHMLAKGLSEIGGTLWVVGDRKGPESLDLPQVRFFHIDDQKSMGFSLAEILPEKHYTRKNLGYLAAIREGADCIVETDDDNLPRPEFFADRSPTVTARSVQNTSGWCNAYRAFTEKHIWPRGLPLEAIHSSEPIIKAIPPRILGNQPAEVAVPFAGQVNDSACKEVETMMVESLIQQGLADQNPDVDAAYRLILPLPLDFDQAPPIYLPRSTWCPFNSQNTTFFKEAFPLLYLPSFCSFRMTDIWRSFVAQRCLWEMDSTLTFHPATVWQERNEHNLLRDFEDEVPGYLNNEKIRLCLESLDLQKGRDAGIVCSNLMDCYSALVEAGIVGTGELPLVQAWIDDITPLTHS